MYDNSNLVLLSLYNMINVIDKIINIKRPVLHFYYKMIIEYGSRIIRAKWGCISQICSGRFSLHAVFVVKTYILSTMKCSGKL